VALNGIPESPNAHKLLEWIQNAPKKGSMLVMTHDHPDPDALASAWALSLLCQRLGRFKCRVAYGGMIGRRENREMFRILDIPAQPFKEKDLDLKRTALVDTQPPFKNNRFPERRKADLIIDHHPRSSKTQAGLVLIEEGVGATSTVLAEALQIAKLRVPKRLATALVYGIGSETQNLGREAGPRDRAAYMAFLPKADMKSLWRITNPRRSASFFQAIARAIRDAWTVKDAIGVHLRELPTPDRVAHMADFFMSHEGMRWSVVTGRYDGKLHVSLRTNRPKYDAGRLLKDLLGGRNRGGGHRMIAGGSIEIGHESPEDKWRKAEESVAAGFLKRIGVSDPDARRFPFRENG